MDMSDQQINLFSIVNHILANDELVASHVRMHCTMKVRMTPPVETSGSEFGFVEDVMSNKLTMVSYERIWTTLMACRYVVNNQIEGDFVECGVWKGGNSIIASQIFKLYGSNKEVWLFDTFAGMTEPDYIDRTVSKSFEETDIKFRKLQREDHNMWCYSSIEEVKNNFSERGLLSDSIHFVQGDVRETLETRQLPEKISVLRLDTDFYDSTLKELEVLYPRLVKGGVLIIDDYGHWQGSKKAVDDYFHNNGNRPFFGLSDYSGRFGVKVF
jgi:O-methyltransferase